MPLYEKECNSCLKEFDFFGKYEDSKKCTCPHCGSSDITHSISAGSSPVFKGEGFYETEHGKQRYNKGKL